MQNCHKYDEGELVIGKLGTNPWWPGIITQCNNSNSNDNNNQVFVKFFEINIESWIDRNQTISCSSRHDMEQYINASTNANANYIPPAMQQLYSDAWKAFDIYQQQQNNTNSQCKRRDKQQHNSNNASEIATSKQSISSSSKTIRSSMEIAPHLCEICVMREIEYDCGTSNAKLMQMTSDKQRRRHFEALFVKETADDDNNNEGDCDGNAVRRRKCSNYCNWKYHKDCLTDEIDLVCSCNKSVWKCSICLQLINVSQLFVCNNHSCMRPYHRTCLSAHLDINPDMKQCPLHSCINCSLDYLVEPETKRSQPHLDLVSCVKCKLAFHNIPNCMPTMFISITRQLIICYRHLVAPELLQSNLARFCFYCSRPIADIPAVSCKFCMVTYHKSVPCLSGTIELIDEHTFVCNACKFPYIHRGQYLALALPREISQNDSMHSWKLGVLKLVTDAVTGRRSVIVTEDTGRKWVTDIHRTISINLQSLNNLVCFGVFRFQDIQLALRHLAKLVERVATSFNLCQNFYRNAFVLRYAGVFPLIENVYCGNASAFMDQSPLAGSEKCDCQDACSTRNCPNRAANAECTDDNCLAQARCRNRRLQKHQFPRYKLLLVDEIGPYVMMDETVVKDVLVSELVGVVKSTAWAEANFDRIGSSSCIIRLSDESVIDCSRFCSMARFIKPSDRPNVQPRVVSVSGFRRIGLFSQNRIMKGDILTIDTAALVYRAASSTQPIRLETWSQLTASSTNQMADELFVIDLCGEDSSDQICDETSQLAPTIAARAPVCPECLQELMLPQSRPRVLIHCRICYAVFHYKCACLSIEFNDAVCNRLEQEARIMNFICQVCSAIRP